MFGFESIWNKCLFLHSKRSALFCRCLKDIGKRLLSRVLAKLQEQL